MYYVIFCNVYFKVIILKKKKLEIKGSRNSWLMGVVNTECIENIRESITIKELALLWWSGYLLSTYFVSEEILDTWLFKCTHLTMIPFQIAQEYVNKILIWYIMQKRKLLFAIFFSHSDCHVLFMSTRY